MYIIDSIFELLLNHHLVNFIIAFQIPIILSLAILCNQAFKLGFPEFKYISYAWWANIFYVFVVISTKKLQYNEVFELLIRTFCDLLTIYFFYLAIRNNIYFFSRFKKITFSKKYFIFILIIVGVIKIIPSSSNYVNYIHVRYIPAAIVDFFVLFSLAKYFNKISYKKKYNFLYFSSLGFAFIQFFAVAQTDSFNVNSILFIDNFGFGLGLVFKTIMLISLSIFIIDVIQKEKSIHKDNFEIENFEKNKLLDKLHFATKILDIKGLLFTNNKAIDEDQILKMVLDECLLLLNEKLGYYASFDKKSGMINIKFPSESYKSINIEPFHFDKGITGKAIKAKSKILMDSKNPVPEYFKFGNKGKHGKGLDIDVKSALAIPVILKEEVIGVYLFESDLEDYFSEVDVKILEALVSQAVAIINNINLIRENELSKLFLNSLKLIDKNLVDQSFELKSIFNIILKQSLEIVGGAIGFIALKVNKETLLIVESTNDLVVNKKIDINNSVSGLAVLDKNVVYIKDIKEENENIKKLYKDWLGEDLICELVVPLIVQGEVIGVFNTESSKSNVFSKADIEKVEGFAGQTSVAIQLAQLFDKEKKQRSLLEMLAEIDLLILNTNQGLNETLETILKKGLELLKQESGSIILTEINSKTGKLDLIVKKSTNPFDEGKIIPRKNNICRLCVDMKKTVYVPFTDKSEFFLEEFVENWHIVSEQEKKDFYITSNINIKSELFVPLLLDNEVIGIFNIESEEYSAFNEEEMNVLKNLVLAAAIAIHNSKLFDEISKKNKALENSVDISKIEMSKSLGKVIDHRIGGSVGSIRTIIKDRFFFGDFGKFSDEVNNQLQLILDNAEKVLSYRNEIKEKIDDFLTGETKIISFREIKEQIEENFELMKNEKITINFKGFDNLKDIYGNINLIMDGVFIELINNAVKSMNKNGGVIEIRGKCDSKFNIIHVIDQGCGIDENGLRKIFNKNYSSWSNNQSGQGNGLGLLRDIIEHYGGKHSIKSKLNLGTTFIIKLPIYKN